MKIKLPRAVFVRERPADGSDITEIQNDLRVLQTLNIRNQLRGAPPERQVWGQESCYIDCSTS
jgi:hypothetical protein